MRAATLVFLGWAACAAEVPEEVPDTRQFASGIDATCPFAAGQEWSMKERRECGLCDGPGPCVGCFWRVFVEEDTWVWYVSDVVQTGTWSCAPTLDAVGDDRAVELSVAGDHLLWAQKRYYLLVAE